MAGEAEHFLDITSEVCPMTFVKTRLLIERMTPGETAEIRLASGEPLENVPDSVTELGHTVLSIEHEAGGRDDVHLIRIRKN
jgi:TusA-related sulfurtransferase